MKIKVIIIGAAATGMGVASKLLRSEKNSDKNFDIHVYQEKTIFHLVLVVFLIILLMNLKIKNF